MSFIFDNPAPPTKPWWQDAIVAAVGGTVVAVITVAGTIFNDWLKETRAASKKEEKKTTP